MLDRIRRIQPSLPSAEKRVATLVLRDPGLIASGTLADVSAAAEVSEPTVVRFCRSAGTDGFREFKNRLTQYLASSNHLVHTDVGLTDTTEQVFHKVMGRTINALIGVKQRYSSAVFNEMVDALARASRIDFYGIGASGLVVADAQNKFFRLGVPCNAYSDSPTILQSAALTNSEYAVIVVSKSGESQTIINAAKTAMAQKANVIAITSPASTLASVVDTCVLVDVDEDTGLFTPMNSRIAQLAILDAAQVATAVKMGERGPQNLLKTKRALNL
ncbi:MAG: MurR/RpiR family transcriptional regulator [Pseudomonadota bacterium]